MFKDILSEMKNSLFSSKFRIKRFIAFLLVPFIYAFTFTYAFFNPFAKSENIPFQVVTQASASNSDFINFLAKELEKPGEIEVGEMKMKIKMKHISLPANLTPEQVYAETVKIAKNGFTTYYLPTLKSPTGNTVKIDDDVEELVKHIKTAKVINGRILLDLVKIIDDMKGKTNIKSDKIHIFNNNRTNFLLGFGSSIAAGMSGKYSFLIDKTLSAIVAMNSGKPGEKELSDAVANLRHSGLLKLRTVHIASDAGEKFSKYGFGLAPFFISIGIWISAIVASMIFHKRIINKKLSATKRFIIKYTTASIFVFVQALILMIPLYFIGFSELSFGNWALMTGMVAFSGIVFLGVVLSIRFIIPNKPLGIFISIILLVVQVVASGGLFPTETQGPFITGMNNVVPMGYSIKLFRESMFYTDVNNLFTNIALLSSFWLVPILAVPIYTAQTKKFYKTQGWEYPSFSSKGGADV